MGRTSLQGGGSSTRITRRQALKAAGAAGGLLGAGLFGGRPPAFAQERTLHLLEWSSFVPEADKEVDRQAAEFGKAEGIKVTVEHINNNDLNARATAAVESGVGADIIQLYNNNPKIYAPGLIDHGDLVQAAGGNLIRKHLRDAVFEKGVYRGCPYFGGGAAYAYRKDLFDQVGAKAPDTLDEFMAAGAKLKKLGVPVGQGLGHSFGDSPGFCHAVHWAFGGKMTDERGRVAIDSKGTRDALAWVKEFWFAACDEGGMGWDDSSNNRAFAAGTISATRNGASIYFVARRNWEKKQDPFVKTIGHFNDPKGPFGNPQYPTTYHRCIFKHSKVQTAAKNFMRYSMRDDNFEKFFIVNGGYVNGIVPKWDDHPFWDSDPALAAFKRINKTAVTPSWPGPFDRRSSEAEAKYILVDMFARYVKGESAAGVIAFAEQELKGIYV